MATGSSTPPDDTFTTVVALAVAGFVAAVGTALLVAGVHDAWVYAAGEAHSAVPAPVAYFGEMLFALAVGWMFVLGGVRLATTY